MCSAESHQLNDKLCNVSLVLGCFKRVHGAGLMCCGYFYFLPIPHLLTSKSHSEGWASPCCCFNRKPQEFIWFLSAFKSISSCLLHWCQNLVSTFQQLITLSGCHVSLTWNFWRQAGNEEHWGEEVWREGLALDMFELLWLLIKNR